MKAVEGATEKTKGRGVWVDAVGVGGAGRGKQDGQQKGSKPRAGGEEVPFPNQAPQEMEGVVPEKGKAAPPLLPPSPHWAYSGVTQPARSSACSLLPQSVAPRDGHTAGCHSGRELQGHQASVNGARVKEGDAGTAQAVCWTHVWPLGTPGSRGGTTGQDPVTSVGVQAGMGGQTARQMARPHSHTPRHTGASALPGAPFPLQSRPSTAAGGTGGALCLGKVCSPTPPVTHHAPKKDRLSLISAQTPVLANPRTTKPASPSQLREPAHSIWARVRGQPG